MAEEQNLDGGLAAIFFGGAGAFAQCHIVFPTTGSNNAAKPQRNRDRKGAASGGSIAELARKWENYTTLGESACPTWLLQF